MSSGTIHISGYIARDSELRYTPAGDAVMDISVPANYGKKDPKTNKKPTQWYSGTVWRERAEKLHQYMVKGQAVVLSGDEPRVETYEKKDGSIGNVIRFNVQTVDFIGSAPEAAESAQQNRAAPAARQASPAARTAAPAQRQAPRAAAPAADFEDDDIPF